MKLVKITWFDHCKYSDTRWRSKEEMSSLTPLTVTTVGWIIKETDDHYVLVGTKANNDYYENEFLILKGTIKKVKVLNGR